MPLIKPQGLQGLKGLGNLSKQEYDSFVERNKDLISQHGYDPVYINNLYSNKQFIDKFGMDQFKAIPDINMRNNLFKDTVVGEEFDKLYSPINADGTRDNTKGLGSNWEKYSQMSTDAKLRLLESDYLKPSEFEENWQKHLNTIDTKAEVQSNSGIGAFMPLGASMGAPMLSTSTGSRAADAISALGSDEGAKKALQDRNNATLEHIYNDDADTKAASLGSVVSQVYNSADPSIVGRSDEETTKLFKAAITPNAATGNLGIPEYASHYGVIEGEGISSEMKDFTIDDMRQVLAKKAVYDQYMSPEMASTALNNEAKRYIHDHQGFGKRASLFAKDVAIAATSYTMDKINGFGNLGFMVADAIGDKPTVYIDDRGEVLPLDDQRVVNTQQGKGYQDEEGNFHPVHAQQIDRTTLYNMGKNVGVFDTAGSNNESILNPQDWTRKEQFGVWDADLAKQYERLGSSPYKVAYNPNDDRDLAYEAFKMMSFGLADAGAQLIPFGIGAFGKAMSTASYMGKLGRAAGAFTNAASKFLTAETRVGQVLQGGLGALGIAEAYQRGAFQETLAQNMANLEETALEMSRDEIYNQYNSDDKYKQTVDSLVDARAAEMKTEYMASLGEKGQRQVVDEAKIDEMIRARAQEQVLGEMVQQRVAERKNTQEYANMQEEAINSAGQAATNTFWPEAIKYGLVNTFGYRKFLYSNPTSVAQKAQQTFNGIREITTSTGKKRLTTDLGKTLTNGEKWRSFGKTAGSMFWGGAWTNGTDDMMVDAAERVNEDSFNRYLHDYKTGESTADTYGFADGAYSYWMGLNNSLGQQTTGEAALVGGFGSLVSANLHFTNIASLATKEGRQAYKDNFIQRYKRDADGMIEKDADGNPIIENVNWKENWRDRLGFFIQNGVLNEYYGKKQNIRDMQRHADYVNDLLDNQDDFNIIQNLVASDIGRDNAANVGDEKTMRFIQAFNAIDALEHLAQDEKDPTTLSSVVNDRKALIERAAKLGTEEEHDFTDEELSNLAAQYYSNNAIPQTEQNTEIALQNIGQNARKMQEAYEAYNDAEQHIQQMEEGMGSPVVPIVRAKMKLSLALDNHWRDRINTMKDEIGDASAEEAVPIGETLIATYGGKKTADSMLKAYNTAEPVLIGRVTDAVDKMQKKLDSYNEAQENLRNATTSEEVFQAQVTLKKAKDAYEDAVEEKMFHEDNLTSFREKKQALEESLAAWEKGDKSRVLSSDEIMALDPVTRARMMHQDNRGLYTTKQQKQIEKLEGKLKKQDPNALQKIQDIALLTTRVNQNEDAYNRISRNPDAAAVQLERQQDEAAKNAVKTINNRNAQIMAEYINQMDQALVGRKDISQKQKDDYAYRTLRNKSSKLLDIIEEQQLLPQYQKQVADAKEWGQITTDIDAVISEADNTDEWKANISRNVSQVIDSANSKEGVIAALEKVIDDTDNTQAATDVETVLQGLEKLGYQRDATVIEKREKRRARQAQEKAAKEAAAKKSQEDAQAEAAKKAAEAEEWANKANKKPGAFEDVNLEDVPLGSDEAKDTNEEDVKEDNKNEVKAEKYGKDISKVANATADDYSIIHRELTSSGKEDYEKNPEKLQNDLNAEVDATVDYLNSKVTAREYLKRLGYSTGDEHSWLDNKATTQEDIIKEANKKAELYKKFISENSQQIAESPVNNNMESNLIDNGETVQGKSSTIDEQATVEGQKEQHTSDEITDVATVNGTGEHVIENSTTTLSGNAMSEYQSDPLQNEGKLEHKKGESSNDSMSKFYAWMDAAGIKLQNIIDTELAEILRRNPQAKVKFMAVRPQSNATNDGDMKRHLMLVLDYDNSINKGITNIHNDENGGVLESNDKKYLVIGIAGYGNKNADKLALYDILFSNNPNSQNGYGLVRRGMGEFFRNNPNERFYVPEGLSTEVVSGTLIPGYIVKQLEGEENAQYRSVTELLKEQQRNPLGLDMQSLAWGIQEKTKFLVVGTSLDRVMVPRNVEGNLGSAFVLVPAANGKMVPSYLKPLFYNEMNDGKLKDRINDLLMDVVSPNYATRLAAVNELSKIFYFGKDGDNILLGKDGSRHSNEVSLKRGEDTLKTFVLNSDFDRQQFMEAIADMNPRINITASVLQSPVMLQQYDEAGALQTDVARLSTAGSAYSIYGVDAQGNMIKPDVVNNDIPRDAANTEFRNGDKTQVIYNHNFYQYDATTDQYLLNGEVVRDANILKQLDYNKRIIENGLAPVQTEGIWKYYILGSEEHPEVVKVNKNTYEVQEVKSKQAQDLIDKVAKEKADQERDAAAKQEMDKLDKMQKEAIEKGEANLSENWVIDPETGELIAESMLKEKKEKEVETPIEQQNPSQKEAASRNEVKPQIGTQGNTQTLNDLVKSKAYRVRVITTVRNKWPQAPTKITELEQFLRDKNIEVDAIGTSETDVQAWIKTLEDCR